MYPIHSYLSSVLRSVRGCEGTGKYFVHCLTDIFVGNHRIDSTDSASFFGILQLLALNKYSKKGEDKGTKREQIKQQSQTQEVVVREGCFQPTGSQISVVIHIFVFLYITFF